ncbi:MAG: carboxyltransferase domain-containing protein, partial [Burkholderiaceae bacterium]
MAWDHVAYVSEDTLVLTLEDSANQNTTYQLALAIKRLKKEHPNWLIDVTAGFGKLMVHFRPEVIDPEQ